MPSDELTEMLLDRHNDVITVYVEKHGKAIRITDDFFTLSDLEISGVDIQDDVVSEILDDHGVINDNGELIVFHYGDDTSSKEYKQKVSSLRNAIHKLSNWGA